MIEIDRKTAGRLLKMSVRTVDRYIKSKKLPARSHDGRILLNKNDVLKLKARHMASFGMGAYDHKMSIDKDMDMSIDNVRIVSTPGGKKRSARSNITGQEIYKNLFEELQSELKEKQQRLEGANYRVGQLEGILKESIPRLDHNRLLLMERAEKQELQVQHESLKVEFDHASEKLRDEKLSKRVFLIFLFVIMLLQPLWLVLSLK